MPDVDFGPAGLLADLLPPTPVRRYNCLRARALSALDWNSERLAAPTELTANCRLESFLNPESLTPAYGAFLARNGLCEGPGVSPLASYRAHQVFLNGIKQRPSA